MTNLEHRYDFVLFFDVQNGNPNGDPDAGNMPRQDPDSLVGLVSDACLKRKVRNYVEMTRGDEPGFDIYVRENAILNDQHKRAYKAVRAVDVDKAEKLTWNGDDEAIALRNFMTSNFYDVRTFGAVMTTKINCGQVRGPVQFTFGHSVEPIDIIDITLTRMAATNEKERDERKVGDDGNERKENQTMGRKYLVPYGLYRAHGFVSASFAKKCGFTKEDLDLFFESLRNMFEHDRSASRGLMSTRKLIIFEHQSEYGDAAASDLFDLVTVARKIDGATVDLEASANLAKARSFKDYEIIVDTNSLPAGVKILG